MCIILIGKITKNEFNRALNDNKDGFSLFTAEQGLIKDPSDEIVDKVINEKQFGIWHFRIGTSGTINKHDQTNIHPFPICGGKYLLYHNGIIGSGDGKRSDTHCLADELMSVSLETAESVVRALSSGNRFVIVNAQDVNDYRIYGSWECDKGILMSHKMYSYGSWKTTSYSTYSSTSTKSDTKAVQTSFIDDTKYQITVNSIPKLYSTVMAPKDATQRCIIRSWLCNNINNFTYENNKLYKNGIEVFRVLLSISDNAKKKLKTPKCKKFTETVLKLYDTGAIWPINNIDTKEEKPVLVPDTEDDFSEFE